MNSSQSDFGPNDFCLNQLLAITHEIFKTFDDNPTLEVRSVSSDIPKAFGKVWQTSSWRPGLASVSKVWFWVHFNDQMQNSLLMSRLVLLSSRIKMEVPMFSAMIFS